MIRSENQTNGDGGLSKMKARIWMGVCLMLGSIVSAGCSQKVATSVPQASAIVEEEVKNTDEVKITDELQATDEEKKVGEVEEVKKDKATIRKEMVERSLISTGNNYRLKKVIEKAKKGEEVTLAYIGGSITEGANAGEQKSYVTVSAESFKNKFATGDNVKWVNAGMSGTPSPIGLIRYERDVIEEAGTLPDVVFIEFAVNDWQEPTAGRAYESLIKTILEAENKPAVVLVFSVFQSRWNLQEQYIPIGEAYQLPMVSILDAVVPALDVEKTLKEMVFFSDAFHPTTYGHQIMADCLTYLFEEVDQAPLSETDLSYPTQSVVGADFVGIKLLDRKTENQIVTIKEGGFTSEDQEVVKFSRDRNRTTFANNWKHQASDTSEPFTVKMEGEKLLLVYKESSAPEAGSVDVYVDGTLVKTVNSYNASGWNNACITLLLDEAESKPHTIELRLTDKDKTFTVLAMGYK